MAGTKARLRFFAAIPAVTLALSCLIPCARAADTGKTGAPAARDTVSFTPYTMDSNFFSCSIPLNWDMQREKDRDEEYRIYEIELVAPESDHAPVAVWVSYYAGNSTDFDGYGDFIRCNAKNALGETDNAREHYEPVKKAVLAGRNGFVLERERMVYLNPESKSDESVQLKEKQYVLPAKDGFYVLHYTSPKTLYVKYLPIFERVAESFKGK